MKKVFIIAEIGINHNGSLDLAKKMILEAKNCGVDAVKFQKRDINLVYTKEELDKPRESPWGNTQRQQKEGLEFSEDQYAQIDKYCQKIEIEWFSSAWDLNSLNFLKKFNLKNNKIASAMIVDKNFLKEVAKQKKHTFISTGMCSMENIRDAVDIFRKENCSFELMHCISAYPFDDRNANLGLISSLKKEFKCDVGYSGHEKGGYAVCFAATALGITSLERHFTLDRTMYGSDQSASITPKAMKDLVLGVRTIEQALQSGGKKQILDIEVEVAKKLRKHLKI